MRGTGETVARESGRGQPHSKTLARGSVGPRISRCFDRGVCDAFERRRVRRIEGRAEKGGCDVMRGTGETVARESGRGQPHSKTLARGSVGPRIYGALIEECAIARQRPGVRLSSAALLGAIEFSKSFPGRHTFCPPRKFELVKPEPRPS